MKQKCIFYNIAGALNRIPLRVLLIVICCLCSNSLKSQNDIDTRIGVSEDINSNMFVLIISNENYKYEQPVPFALNDGMIFKLYCEKTLGIPSKNIHYSADATLNDMRMQLMWLDKVMKAYSGEARAIVYYSGHGMPSEDGKHAYLLPVDGNSQLANSGLSTQQLYKQLGAMPSLGTIVLLDACFSGVRRDGQMLASSRGVAIKAKEEPVTGNLVVFSAAQGDETAYPYKDYKHGLFTFYILSALQEKGGFISLGELADIVTKQVSRTSIVENGKSQTPSITASINSPDWRKWMFARSAAKQYENINHQQPAYTNNNTPNPVPQLEQKPLTSNSTKRNGSTLNIGYINSQEIIQLMPEFQRAKNEMEALTAQYENELKRMQDDLQRKGEAFEKEQKSLSYSAKQSRQQELQKLYETIQQTYQNNQQSLNSFQKEKMESVTRKVLDVSRQIGTQYNFIYIFDNDATIAINPVYVKDLTNLAKYRMGLGGVETFKPIQEGENMLGYVNTEELSALLANSSSFSTLEESEKTKQIDNQIKNAMNSVVIKHGFTLILKKGSGIPFMSYNCLVDATPLVKAELGYGGVTSFTHKNITSNTNFGYFNSQAVISAMPEYQKAKKEVETLTAQYENELKRMQDDLQRKGEAFEKEQKSLSYSAKQSRQQELQKLYETIQQTYQNNQQSLNNFQQEKMRSIVTKVLNAVDEIGQAGNYTLILELESGVPYISTTSSTDVTAQVKAKLGL